MIKRNILWNIYIIAKLFLDLSLSVLIFFLAYYIRFYDKIFTSIFPPVKGIPELKMYYDFIPFYIFVVLFSFIYSGYYRKELLSEIDEFLTVIKGGVVIGILLFAVSFFYRGYEYSRFFMLIIVALNVMIIYTAHEMLKVGYNKYLKYIFGKPRIGIIGSENTIARIKDKIHKNKTVRLYFLNTSTTVVLDKDRILEFVNNKGFSELLVEYSIFSSLTFQELLPELDQQDIEVRVIVDVPVKLSDTVIDASLGIPVITTKPVSLSPINFFIKRTMDIIISILVLSFFLIPGVFIALWIKFSSPGPVFFIHKRAGMKGRSFNCIKFRTMVKDAHKKWWEMLKYSERGDKVLKIKNDPRVTREGKILRKFSIDEIPQFFNILKGDMSIVGPRPQIVEETSFYDHYTKRRLMILPGLTGLWQISGRADVGFEDMVKLDLYYLENWSLGLDLKIIWRTIFTIFSQKGAY